MSQDIHLQRYVAERVMGWSGLQLRDGELWGHPPESSGCRLDLTAVPNFATDLPAAWLVVEEMRRCGYGCEISLSTTFRVPVVSFGREEKLGVEYECENVAEAICRAAIKTLKQDNLKDE